MVVALTECHTSDFQNFEFHSWSRQAAAAISVTCFADGRRTLPRSGRGRHLGCGLRVSGKLSRYSGRWSIFGRSSTWSHGQRSSLGATSCARASCLPTNCYRWGRSPPGPWARDKNRSQIRGWSHREFSFLQIIVNYNTHTTAGAIASARVFLYYVAVRY